MSQKLDPQAFLNLSTASNPLTAALPKKDGQSPTERAAERFSITGNAIVTGGAGGLGLELCRALLEHGLKGVCIFDLPSTYETAKEAIQSLHDDFPNAKIIEEVVDVSNEDEVERGVEKTVQTLGSVDILSCYHGIARGGSVTQLALEDWKKVLDVNLSGCFLTSKHVGKQMIKQGTGGSVIFASSIAGHIVLFPLYQSAYSVTKAGIIQLKSCLAAEWAQYGIRVNSVSPGFFDTPMTKGADVGIKAYEERCPIGRMGIPSELTGPVILFCSPAGRYITGVDLLVDGGALVF